METHQKATEYGDALLYDYDVFLSFRGPDTRTGFTDFLYKHLTEAAGLRVFRDDDELKLGDEINKILQEIDNSRLCIPIFSKRFAESKWCLWEVTRMVERRKHILPIFCGVTVDDVNLETPVYNEFMPKHVAGSGEKEVEKWKEALKKIATLDGKQVLSTGGSYTEFCESFVKETLIKLKIRRKFDFDALIGLEDQVRHAMQLLDINSTAVRYFGIYGMGGIGKTTLAKDIFNQIEDQFDGSCFLEDLRESFRRHGTTFLMKKLLNNLNILASKGEPDEDLSRLMEERFRSKKILLVLDDVDQWEQILKFAGKSSWFGSGSRVIVTSRDKSVIERGVGKLSDGEVWDFEMEPLGHDYALQLFNRHAFKEGIPPAGLEMLSEKAVSLMGGLPLALKIISSALKERKREVWEEVIEKLKKIPYSDVKERLRISYDSLEREQQQIFLDIACFFIGNSVTKPIYMWKATEFCPNSGLEILSFRSLVKVSDDGKLSMHDQLRDLGRDIVREENNKIPAYRSRLWEDDTAKKVLKTKKNKPNVEALRIEGEYAIDLTQQQEKPGSLENLRYLDLQRANLQGDFQNIFPELIWFSFHCHINLQATTFAMTNLAILDFSSTNIDETWLGWSQLKNAPNLKVLDLSEAEHLTRTPYFPEGMVLERLILDYCSNLVVVDGSIGHLKCLKFLSLKRCYSLTGLPEEVGHLEQMKYIVGGHTLHPRPATSKNLDLRECSLIGTEEELNLPKNQGNVLLGDYQIFSLPRSFGNLLELKLLSLAHLPIEELPESFGGLKNLIVLDLRSTKISNLSNSIEGLVELEELYLCGCHQLKKLPPTLGALKSLVILDLSHTALVELPSSVGELARLKQLNLAHCSAMEKLPYSVGTISSLVELDLTSSGVLELPESIGGLENLKKLDMSASSNIKALPDTVGHLKRLVLLNLSRTGITELPESIGGLENLTEIRLVACPLKALPKSFGTLKKLEKFDADSADLSGGLHDISGLSSLTALRLSNSQICELPSSINQLHRLNYLYLMECNQLRELPDLPMNLMELLISSSSLDRVHQLSNLQSLKALILLSTRVASSDSIFGIWKLSQLVTLKLWLPANTTLPDEFENLTRLKVLKLGGPSLRSVRRLPLSLENMYVEQVRQNLDLPNLPDLRNLSSLEVNIISASSMLRLSLPESLRELKLRHSDDLVSGPNISHLKNLRTLHVLDCQSLTEIPGIGKLKSLEYLVIERCPSLMKLENLSELEKIEYVRIDSCRNLGYPEGIDRSKVIILAGDFQEITEATTNELHNICSLLSSPGRDFLIQTDGCKVKVDSLKGKKVCLYFQQSSWDTFGYMLSLAYGEWHPRRDCVVVRVPPNSEAENIFNKLFFWMDWLAVPVSDGGTRRRLSTLFKRRPHEIFNDFYNVAPQLVIFDESGRVLTTEGFELIGSYGPLAYPFTPERIQYLKSWEEDIHTNQSITSIFSFPLSTDFVLTFDGNELPVSELEGKIVGIYFSTLSSYKCTGFTSMLREVNKELKANGESFEIVWAPIDKCTTMHYRIFRKLPTARVSTWIVRCFRLCFYFKVSALPTLVIIGEDGKTLQANAAEAIEVFGAKAYPFTPEKIENARKEECKRLFSSCKESVITNTGERVDASTLVGKNILLYFAAAGCSDCSAFSPKLVDAYSEIRARNDAFEVIFISNDQVEASFHECFSTMPWLALPSRDEKIGALAYVLEITIAPTVVAVGRTDQIITKDVAYLIMAYGSDAYPFTDEHISNIMVKSWPLKLHYAFHAHELALTDPRVYRCMACYFKLGMPLWSYHCKECNFNLHPKCTFKEDRWGSREELGTRRESMARETLKKIIDSIRVSSCSQFSIMSGEHQLQVSDLLGKNILLYFSRQNPICCAFMPKLLEAYNEIKARDDAFEVISLSDDLNEVSFRQSFSLMPWLALPFRDERIPLLALLLEVTQISTLVAIGPTDQIISKDVRNLIVAYGSNAYPFTDEHIRNIMVKSWPLKMQHPLHPQHELALTDERSYICDACNFQLPVRAWSYCCKDCDFDLHPKCAFEGGSWESREQSESR